MATAIFEASILPRLATLLSASNTRAPAEGNGNFDEVLHFLDAFIELIGATEGGFARIFQRLLALFEQIQEIRGHEIRVVVVEFENHVACFDPHTFEDVPLSDATGNLRLDVLRALKGGIGESWPVTVMV